uniref:Uncharacterized protein n=1 Tax=Trichuris muris TaxID=70415 RepID=A0A5S6QY00_TRIMR
MQPHKGSVVLPPLDDVCREGKSSNVPNGFPPSGDSYPPSGELERAVRFMLVSVAVYGPNVCSSVRQVFARLSPSAGTLSSLASQRRGGRMSSSLDKDCHASLTQSNGWRIATRRYAGASCRRKAVQPPYMHTYNAEAHNGGNSH